ncbi:hypothetical protein RQP46_009171 [Phenoliferia psychrophenolica]
MDVGDSCGACGKLGYQLPVGKKFLKCSRCLKSYYCDAKCQKSAWPAHKERCQVVQTFNNRSERNALASTAEYALQQTFLEFVEPLDYAIMFCLHSVMSVGHKDYHLTHVAVVTFLIAPPGSTPPFTFRQIDCIPYDEYRKKFVAIKQDGTGPLLEAMLNQDTLNKQFDFTDMEATMARIPCTIVAGRSLDKENMSWTADAGTERLASMAGRS